MKDEVTSYDELSRGFIRKAWTLSFYGMPKLCISLSIFLDGKMQDRIMGCCFDNPDLFEFI